MVGVDPSPEFVRIAHKHAADCRLAVFEADFVIESVAIWADDPLEVCMDAHREFSVHETRTSCAE